MKATLGKSEKLKSRKAIKELFQKGKKLNDFPVVAFYHAYPSEKPSVKMTVSIPKKKVKLAVKRNLLKRKIKEHYRTQKQALVPLVIEKSVELNLMFVFIGSIENEKDISSEKIKQLIERLINSLGE